MRKMVFIADQIIDGYERVFNGKRRSGGKESQSITVVVVVVADVVAVAVVAAAAPVRLFACLFFLFYFRTFLGTTVFIKLFPNVMSGRARLIDVMIITVSCFRNRASVCVCVCGCVWLSS